jgi:hypothetical protein
VPRMPIFDHCVHLGCEAILVKGFKQTDLPTFRTTVPRLF